jgi:tetratricopeptide (TPR) repeat protein
MQATIRLNTEKMFFQAVVKIRRGDYDGALADLDLVIADNPNNESAYLQRGRVLRKNGRKTAALRDYEQATKLSPKLVAAHIGRGELLLVTERYQQSQSAFESALNLQSESAPAIAGMALARYAQDDAEQGRELWSWLIERDSNYADPVWAGQVFDWEDDLVERAKELLANA